MSKGKHLRRRGWQIRGRRTDDQRVEAVWVFDGQDFTDHAAGRFAQEVHLVKLQLVQHVDDLVTYGLGVIFVGRQRGPLPGVAGAAVPSCVSPDDTVLSR